MHSLHLDILTVPKPISMILARLEGKSSNILLQRWHLFVCILWIFRTFYFSWCSKNGAFTAFESSYWLDTLGECLLGHGLCIPPVKTEKFGFVFNRANFEFEKVPFPHFYAKKRLFWALTAPKSPENILARLKAVRWKVCIEIYSDLFSKLSYDTSKSF